MTLSTQTLQTAGGFPFELVHSKGVEERAQQAADIVAGGLPVLSQVLGFSPRLQLVVLSRADWPQHAARQVYGTPHNFDGDTIVVGADPAGFWSDSVAMIEPSLGPGESARLHAHYGEQSGLIDVRPFTSLIVLHQLGHIFHQQVPFDFPRRWLRELFANMCVYTAVVNALPERLDDLEMLPLSLTGAPAQLATRRTLSDFAGVTLSDALENFVWYQFRLVVAAKAIYEAAGSVALRRFFDLFLRCCDRPISDDELSELLERKVAPEVALVMSSWPHVSESAPAL
ncbi:MAG TPA: hypothetical protein VFY90_13855 [Tepidiformaceae bacterium]|nr:hypothetical protein [Tepidiformaceae bacterium]